MVRQKKKSQHLLQEPRSQLKNLSKTFGLVHVLPEKKYLEADNIPGRQLELKLCYPPYSYYALSPPQANMF